MVVSCALRWSLASMRWSSASSPEAMLKSSDMRPIRYRSYAAYSVGVVVVWAVILVVIATTRPGSISTFLLLFGGWAIGWVSGTIARYVYPPPQRWRAPIG
jgi:hypothetical protein